MGAVRAFWDLTGAAEDRYSSRGRDFIAFLVSNFLVPRVVFCGEVSV